MATLNVPFPRSRSGGATSPDNALENGDHLSRGEFERRYEARPDIKKADELVDGVYRPRQPDAAGVMDSSVFPGLRLAVDAMLRGDLGAVLRELERGLDGTAHETFVTRLGAGSMR